MDETARKLLLIACGIGIVSGAAGAMGITLAFVSPLAAPDMPAQGMALSVGILAVSVWGSVRLLGWKPPPSNPPIIGRDSPAPVEHQRAGSEPPAA